MAGSSRTARAFDACGLADARLSPSDIGVVYAGANGAVALDDLEARALREVFPDNDPVVTSIKGTIGESGATGAAACIAAVVCGAVQEVPPISGIDIVAPGAAELNIAKTRCRLPSPFALINSVSSGGRCSMSCCAFSNERRGS